MSEEKHGLATALAKKLGQDIIPTAKEEHTSGKTVLMHSARLHIFLTAYEKPGLSLQAMARETSSPLTSTKRYLALLEREGLLAVLRTGGKTYYYPPLLISEGECGIVRLMADPIKREIYISVEGGRSGIVSISRAVKMKASSASYQMESLIAGGLVEKDGRKYKATEKLAVLKKSMGDRAEETTEAILEVLKLQNLSPSGTRKFKNRIRVMVTIGEQRRWATVYTVPVTLG